MKMPLKTERLVLRPWKDEDAENLYEYAKTLELVLRPAGMHIPVLNIV